MRPALFLAALLLALPGCILHSDRGYGWHELPDGSRVPGGPAEKAACDFHQARWVKEWSPRAEDFHGLAREVDMASDARDPKRYAAATAALGAAMVDMDATTHAPPIPKKTATK